MSATVLPNLAAVCGPDKRVFKTGLMLPCHTARCHAHDLRERNLHWCCNSDRDPMVAAMAKAEPGQSNDGSGVRYK